MRSATRVLAGHRKRQRRRPAILELQGWLMHAMELGLELGLPNLREILDVISGVRESSERRVEDKLSSITLQLSVAPSNAPF